MADQSELEATIRALVQKGKGILAADESSPTIAKRFKSIGVESTEENRRVYREFLLATPGLGDYISGVIFFEETLGQRTGDGTPLPQLAARQGIVPGIDPERRSYFSRATFADPDGNTWQLQELTERLPGRVSIDPAALSKLLLETSIHHGAFEAVAPPHDWWDWYAAYMVARQGGAEPDAASEAGNRYMAEVKHIVVPAE